MNENNFGELAFFGGTPVRTKTFPAWPHFESEEIEAAAAVLRSGRVNYWTGEEGRLFEQEFATIAQRSHAVAVANGSVGLELALYALRIGLGDEVIVTSRSFIASASSIVLRGAVAVFADVDRDSQNITADTIKAVISPRTRAIIVVHLAGWPCEMDAINALAREHGLFVIEDCAQAHGAAYKDRPVGSYGDIAVFSFCQDKIMSTGGEGGMVVTNDPMLWEKVWSFKDHGKNFQRMSEAHSSGGFRWVHDNIGTNLRMTEMQSAIGRVLARRLWRSVESRRQNAATLSAEFAAIPGLRVTTPGNDVYHSYYKYYVFVQTEKLSDDWNRDRVVDAIRAEGVPCYSGSCSEIYQEKAFSRLAPGHARLPVAKELGENSLMFLVHPTLTGDDIADTGTAVRKVMARAVRAKRVWFVAEPSVQNVV